MAHKVVSDGNWHHTVDSETGTVRRSFRDPREAQALSDLLDAPERVAEQRKQAPAPVVTSGGQKK